MNQPTRLEFDAITPAQAERDLTTTLQRLREHRAQQDPDAEDKPIRCHIDLDLNPDQP